MLVVQTVQVAKEILDSDFSLFAIGAFLFGHKQRFLWTPYTAKFLVFHRANSAPGYFSVCDRRRCCSLVLLDVFRVLRYELMLATDIQPRLSKCQPGDWFPDVILNVCNTYIPEPSLAKFQALKNVIVSILYQPGLVIYSWTRDVSNVAWFLKKVIQQCCKHQGSSVYNRDATMRLALLQHI